MDEWTHFVKVLQEVNNSSLNLWLREAGSGGVTSRSVEDGRGVLESWDSRDRTSNWAGSSHSLAGSSACRSEENCAEHGGGCGCWR